MNFKLSLAFAIAVISEDGFIFSLLWSTRTVSFPSSEVSAAVNLLTDEDITGALLICILFSLCANLNGASVGMRKQLTFSETASLETENIPV